TILNIAALDGNKDGKVDLITADHSTGGVCFYQSIGGGKFSTPTTLGTVGLRPSRLVNIATKLPDTDR
ncbi:MAG: hypothetical protein ACO3V7_12170, partial [Burkholderiaceae bacterium]